MRRGLRVQRVNEVVQVGPYMSPERICLSTEPVIKLHNILNCNLQAKKDFVDR